MKITELLSVPAEADDVEMHDDAAEQQEQSVATSHFPPPQQQRRMDMASLDLFAQQKQQQPRENLQRSRVQDLSMNRIIQELQSGPQLQLPVPTLKRPVIKDETPSSSALAAAAMLSFTQNNSFSQQQQPYVETRPSRDSAEPPAAAEGTHTRTPAASAIRKPKQQARASSSKKAIAGRGGGGDTVVATVAEAQDDASEEEAGDDEDERGGGGRRRTRNGFAPLTESEKRVKQRQLVKRSYYRKIDTIKELREVAEKLEDEFQAVLDGRRRYSAQHKLELSPFEALREKYTQLAISKDDLRLENEALRSIAAEQSKARTRVGILVDEELREQEEVARVAGITPLVAASTPPLLATKADTSAKPVLEIKPISQTECREIVKDAYGHIMEFRDAQNFVTTGASVFGWRDRRKVEGDTMKFFLEKTFPCPAETVATTMWGILSTETGVNRIYSSDIAIKFHLVQRVDDNNVVFYRTIEREGQGVTIKSLVLGSLVQIETGFLLLFRSLDPSQRLCDNDGKASSSEPPSSVSPFVRKKREVWSDVFSWGLYEHTAEGNQGHCRNSFGGFVPSSTATTLEFWLMHILLIAVRCENEAIGPVFVLQ